MGNPNGAPIGSTLRTHLIGSAFFYAKVSEMMLVINMIGGVRLSCLLCNTRCGVGKFNIDFGEIDFFIAQNPDGNLTIFLWSVAECFWSYK